jgi:hypothetical protein
MKTRLLPLLAVLVMPGFHGVAVADEPPDYIRFREDATSTRLESAIRSFTLPSGQRVDLIGAVHIADDAYYQELNRRFGAYDSVLFELVGDPKGLAAPSAVTSRSAVSTIQQTAGQYLKLRFQLDAIDYTPKNMVHADTTAEEFDRMQKERGETMLTLFGRAMQAQMAADMTGSAHASTAGGLDTFGLIRILMSRDSAAEFKKALARMLAQTESLTATVEGENGSAILSGRNEVVGRKIKEVLANRKQHRVAVFYGCAHMPGIETSLRRDMKAKTSGDQWLAAWTMPK